MAKLASSSLHGFFTPTPLKGFIELPIADKQVAVALSNIVSVAQTDAGCAITLVNSVPALELSDMTAYFELSYHDVIERIKEAR